MGRLSSASHSANDRRGERGAALVEFALVLALLCVVVLGTIDFGRVFYMAMALSNAARAGAQYGSQGINKTTDTNGMVTAAQNSATPDIGPITATASQACECDGGAMASCPPAGTCPGTLRVYVTVTTSTTFNMISGFPGLPSAISLTRSAVMRAQ